MLLIRPLFPQWLSVSCNARAVLREWQWRYATGQNVTLAHSAKTR